MLHFTVGTSPSGEVNLENDLQVLKSALLYADKVKLCSLTTSMLLSMLAMRDLKPDQQMDFLESLIPVLVPDPQAASNALANLQLFRLISRKKQLSKQELLLRAKLRPMLTKHWNELREIINDMLLKAGMGTLIDIAQTGTLELHFFDISGRTDNNSMIQEYFDVLTKTISDGSTYPLFDAQAGDLIRLGLQEGKITVSEAGVTRGKHSGLAAHLLERLPLFEEASVDEILDIRQELERPLIRFRSAIIKFSKDIKTASWDQDFQFEADQVFQRDVEPAILDIEEAVRSNNYLTALTRKFADKPLAVPGGSALAMLMSHLSAVPDVVSQALGIGVASGVIAYDAYKEWQKGRQTAEQNQLYFYYRAGELLSNRTYEYRKDQ
jgi:hypothetical protein